MPSEPQLEELPKIYDNEEKIPSPEVLMRKPPSLWMFSAPQGYWELARFHSREHWLQCFPAVWGICLSSVKNGTNASIYKISYILCASWLSMMLLHGSFCTWNDFVDCKLDAKVERTRKRPIPSGRVTRAGALYFFLVLCSTTAAITYGSLGLLILQISLPIYFIALIYPFMKRLVSWPQLVLAPAVAWPAFCGWVSVTGNTDDIGNCVPLFLCYCVWTIYFDTCYGIQDKSDDKRIGVKSLSISTESYLKPFLAVLASTILGLLGLAAYQANCSSVYWVLVVGVWAVRMVFQLRMIDTNDPRTGGLVFQENITLGLYVTAVSVAELVWRALGA